MRTYIRLTGVLYALVALIHLVRLVRRWPLLIAGFPLPEIASLVVFMVAGALAIWAWRLLGAESAPKTPPAGQAR